MGLIEKGAGGLSEVDRAYIYQVAGRSVGDAGHIDQSAELLQRATTLLRGSHTPWALHTLAYDLSMLGFYQAQLGRNAEGIANAQAGVEIAATISGKKSVLYADALLFLGQAQHVSGDYEGARRSLQIAAGTRRKNQPDPIYFVGMLVTLADTSRELGDYDGAESLYSEAIDFMEHNSQGHYGGTYAKILNGKALLERNLDHVDQERELLERALSSGEQHYGLTNSISIAPLSNLRILALHKNDIDAAEGYFQRAAQIFAQNSGPANSYRAYI